MVTLRDVATSVGLSAKTVSRVVNGDPAVHPDTRELVQAAIDRLGYVPDQAARMMRLATAPIVGLLTDRVATTPYSVDIIAGAEEALSDRQLALFVASGEGQPARERAYWQAFRAQKATGVIYATMFHRPVDLGQTGFDRPVVLANCYSTRRDTISVVPDDEAGGYVQARHAISCGHRRIGIISLNPALRAMSLRGAGHRGAFSEAGLSFDADFEVPGFIGPLDDERLIAYEAARQLLKRSDRPTAILCGSDRVALQVYAAAASLGLTIPDDLSVIGFDDMRVLAEALVPKLTTVALPYREIGRRAAEIVAAGATNGQGGRIVVPCPLVVRDSCRDIG